MEASALQAPVALNRQRSRVGTTILRLRSDEQLVALLRAGHDEAFSVIHDRYRQRLLAYALQMLRSRQDAEDVLQDVFERAYTNLRRSHDERALVLRPWLYRIAHNRCIDQLRRPAPPAPELLAALGIPACDPEMEVDRRDALRRLMVDVGRLPDQQRSALLMRELGGISYADVAAALSVSVPAVKSLLVRARVSLAEAGEARDAACVDIRAELVDAHEGRVRPNARARRHMRDCPGCREFRGHLRGTHRGVLGILPAAGPLGCLARLLGGGGTGGGAAAAWSGSAATATGGGGIFATAGALAGSAGHVATLVAATAVAAGGAAAIGGSGAAAVHHHVHHAGRSAAVTLVAAAVDPVARVVWVAPATSAVGVAPPAEPVMIALAPPATAATRTSPPATIRPTPSYRHVNVLDAGELLAPAAPDPGQLAPADGGGPSVSVTRNVVAPATGAAAPAQGSPAVQSGASTAPTSSGSPASPDGAPTAPGATAGTVGGEPAPAAASGASSNAAKPSGPGSASSASGSPSPPPPTNASAAPAGSSAQPGALT